MNEYHPLSHTKWECKYHVVFIPKARRKVLYGQLRQYWGEVVRELARQKERRVEGGQLQADHVHMLWSLPPKDAVAQVLGYIKGKSAIPLARAYGGRVQNFVGDHFRARGYFATAVGHDEEAVRRYIRAQRQRTDDWGS
jgi:putative transposase